MMKLPAPPPVPAEFLRFAAAGAAGFAVDSLMLLAFVNLAGLQPLQARLASFALALASTWLINRMWTFRIASADKTARGIGAEFLGYSAVQLTGGAANFAVYGAIVGVIDHTPLKLLGALAAGSATALVINYAGARKFVFGGR